MIIEMYTKPSCPYCTLAEGLIERKGLKQFLIKIVVDRTDTTFDELEARMGETPKTVPQIFVNSKHVGGYEELCDYEFPIVLEE